MIDRKVDNNNSLSKIYHETCCLSIDKVFLIGIPEESSTHHVDEERKKIFLESFEKALSKRVWQFQETPFVFQLFNTDSFGGVSEVQLSKWVNDCEKKITCKVVYKKIK